MTEINYCIVCLSTGVKLFGLKDYSLGQIYSDLTKITVTNWNQHLCYECTYLIRKYQKFKLKCIQTNDLLTFHSLTVSLTGLTKNVLETLQTQHNIHSNLVLSDITTEDLLDVESTSSNVGKIKIEKIMEESYSTDSMDKKDNGMFILHQDTFDTVPIEYTKQNLLIEDNLEKNAVFCQALNPFDNIDNESCEFLEQEPNSKNIARKVIPKCETKTENQAYNKDDCLNNVQKRKLHKQKVNKKKVTKTRKVTQKKLKNITKKVKQEVGNQLKVNLKPKTLSQTKREVEKNLKKIKWGGITRTEYIKNKVANNIKKLKMNGSLEYLTQEEAKSEVTKRAESDNYINSPYKCKLCFRGFTSEETLANHMVKHSLQKGEFECDNCHARFPTKSTLYKHINMYHKIKFSCAKCSYVSEKFDKALKHLLIHEGKTYDCRFCDKKFKVDNSLANHIHLKHQDEFDTQYICELCGNSFHNQFGLTLHKDMVHFNVKNEYQGPECEQCGLHFTSKLAWERHLVTSRNHETPAGAEVKDPQKAQQNNKQAVRKRGDSRHYICQFCGHDVTTLYWYKWHLYKYHDQPKPAVKPANKLQNLICEVCGDKFSNKTVLQTHIRKHTGELPYKCEYCGKGFRLHMVLKIHENLHTRAKIYKCDVCEKEFLRRTSYSKHVRQHMGLTPHKCLECDRNFVNLADLKSHIKHKHENVPYPQRKNPRNKGPKIEKIFTLHKDGV